MSALEPCLRQAIVTRRKTHQTVQGNSLLTGFAKVRCFKLQQEVEKIVKMKHVHFIGRPGSARSRGINGPERSMAEFKATRDICMLLAGNMNEILKAISGIFGR